LLRTLGRLFAGYYTAIPNRDRLFDALACSLVAIAALVIVALNLVKKPPALAFYLLANGLILGFTYVKFMPQFHRHFGNLYLVLFGALWLAQQSAPSTALTRHLPILERGADRARRWLPALLITILVVHLAGGLYRFSLDLVVPHSAGRAAAAYIRQANLQEAFIVGSRDAEMAPLSGYLGRPLYYPERQALGSYTLFFKGDRQEVEQAEVWRQVSDLLDDHPQLLLVLTDELAVSTPEFMVEFLKAFERSQNETYYLYWVQREAR
jgi:hypothetical protein